MEGKYNGTLPADFDGIFRFTNPSDEDFVAKWDNREYIFPANSTSPMVIRNATPEEVQQIRKKFAQDLAEREFFKSEKLKKMEASELLPDGTPRFTSFKKAGLYSIDSDLAPYIQRCLEPLPISHALVREVEREDITDKMARDERSGELVTDVIDRDLNTKVSLGERAKAKAQ